jgi:hypothetical protein
MLRFLLLVLVALHTARAITVVYNDGTRKVASDSDVENIRTMAQVMPGTITSNIRGYEHGAFLHIERAGVTHFRALSVGSHTAPVLPHAMHRKVQNAVRYHQFTILPYTICIYDNMGWIRVWVAVHNVAVVPAFTVYGNRETITIGQIEPSVSAVYGMDAKMTHLVPGKRNKLIRNGVSYVSFAPNASKCCVVLWADHMITGHLCTTDPHVNLFVTDVTLLCENEGQIGAYASIHYRDEHQNARNFFVTEKGIDFPVPETSQTFNVPHGYVLQVGDEYGHVYHMKSGNNYRQDFSMGNIVSMTLLPNTSCITDYPSLKRNNYRRDYMFSQGTHLLSNDKTRWYILSVPKGYEVVVYKHGFMGAIEPRVWTYHEGTHDIRYGYFAVGQLFMDTPIMKIEVGLLNH